MKPFRHFSRWPHHFARYSFMRNTVFEHQFHFDGKTLFRRHQRAMRVHAESHCLKLRFFSREHNVK